MIVIEKNEYENILKNEQLSMSSKDNIIDIYHCNNWDHFTMHWDEPNKNDTPSYIDFFFDSKSMVCFFKEFLENVDFNNCYISSFYNDKYKLKLFDDDVCKDIYNEFKTLFNSLGLKINTSKAIQMSKIEFIDWCDRFSIGGFCGVSEYSVLIPELNILILPHHHMNYLICSNNKQSLIPKLTSIPMNDLLLDY